MILVGLLHRSPTACHRVFLVQRANKLFAGVGSPTDAGTGGLYHAQGFCTGIPAKGSALQKARRDLHNLLWQMGPASRSR
ncbi:hypothetical protein CE91St62_23970 [Lachnospiraceae bacterium]|nr:hypothetical protein CE91St61_24070 [Lachnospiraceae bacterium]BDF38336.1 hypothetical protein CE91St62_23970 [Lachnospiraceae bacterium]